MFTRAWRGCVIQRCQNKNPRLESGPGYLGDVTHRKRGLRFEKKQLVEFPPRKKKVDFQSWARPDDFVPYERRGLIGLRADEVKAVSIERLCLSPHVEKHLNSKRWIKVSYLNQFHEFRVFRFPMSISPIRIMGMLHMWPSVLQCNIIVNTLELKSTQCIHFWTNNLRKDMNPAIPPTSYRLKKIPLLFFF